MKTTITIVAMMLSGCGYEGINSHTTTSVAELTPLPPSPLPPPSVVVPTLPPTALPIVIEKPSVSVVERELSTTWLFVISVGGVSHKLEPTPQDRQIVLPQELSEWSCRITEAFFTDDGKGIYHNIACNKGNITIGESISCDVKRVDFSHKAFWMRPNHLLTVGFEGECQTQ